MTFRSRRIFTPVALILAFFLALIPFFLAGSGIFAKTVSGSISSTEFRLGEVPTRGNSAQAPVLSGTSLDNPMSTVTASRADGTGLCHHPGTSPVPLWECSHDRPAGSISSSTLLAADISLPSENLFTAGTLPPIPPDLPSSRFFGLSPEHPPKSFTSVL